ncbi:MAG: EutN/CcmL family microcompartment protein [Ignavibacteriaceae bacterium]|nr:EutN/CcmL family microcompartment protein [Ignavibacteriaceae bacterium]NUM71041.1 EutN/CcmL family microcompartment protein [Ignavibacteriaceae bacterium]
MFLARVKGNVISSHKNSFLTSHKLLTVRKVDLEGRYIEKKDTIAIDLTGAGPGEIVIVTQEGDAVQQILGHGNAPVHTIIVGIVDKISLADKK